MKYRSLKGLCYVGVLTLLLLGLSSCNKNDFKTFAELKEEQADAVERLISEKKLKVEELKEAKLPENYNKDVYYKFPNGLYMRVLDKGEGKVKLNTELAVAFKGNVFSLEKKGLPSFDNMSDGSKEFTFFNYTYYYNQGDVHFSLSQENGGASLDSYMCEGLAYPMTQLGDKATVSLIIPFEIGPQITYKDGLSLFIERASYIVMKK